MADQPREPVDPEVAKAGSTEQDYGNLSVEDDAEGTTDPAELAGSGSADDDGGPKAK